MPVHPQSAPDRTIAIADAEDLKFLFRARVTGTVPWTCPQCGYINEDVLRPPNWYIRCGNGKGCRRVWGLGMILYSLRYARRRPVPRDLIIPGRWGEFIDPLPVGEIADVRDIPGYANRIR
jgi:hypothetical protein